ncbi:UDP-N-acetylmuramoyl-L-alanine--D-glutamate ligase [bacterium]|nr:UDP-N-acetylmuramoyl-L-alanine--D-glutamate ligase [bacterium]
MVFKREHIPGSRITVLGAARSGVDAALLLAGAGARVFLSEMAPASQRKEEAARLEQNHISCEFGGHTDRVFEAELIVTSPGIPDSHPLFREAAARHIELLGELEVASWFCEAPIAAVTGSNGKSTTTALLGEMIRAAGIPCIVAGNIGTTLSSQAGQTVPGGAAVVEVSNFQLETVRDFRPRVAVFLNLTPDHLDRHGSMEMYGSIKARIFRNQTETDAAVYNGDDTFVAGQVRSIKSRRLPFQKTDPGTDGAFTDQGWLILKKEGSAVRVIKETDMGIQGPHNTANALAAILAADQFGVTVPVMREVLSRFSGLAHRMEFVRELNGIRWINDSKATNTDSMECALKSYQTPVILIAGGRDKNSDFTRVRPLIQEKTRSVILIGEAADKMEDAWQNASPIVRAGSLEAAVQLAAESALPDDVVLLSPGCASFDMFNNFEDRGSQFKTLVNAL